VKAVGRECSRDVHLCTALATFVCVLCTLRTQSSRPICVCNSVSNST
jgi:hypothetical protein